MEEYLIDSIFKILSTFDVPSLNVNGTYISLEDFVLASLPNNETSEIATILSCSYSVLNAQLSRKYRKIFVNKPAKILWADYFLSLIGRKYCKKCKNIKYLEQFNNCQGKFLNKRTDCRDCQSLAGKHYYLNNKIDLDIKHSNHYYANKEQYIAKSARRRAAKLQATPKWADIEKIKKIYSDCPKGYHVDHVIPLINDLVCGLHVENNLKAIPAADNLAKGNKFILD